MGTKVVEIQQDSVLFAQSQQQLKELAQQAAQQKIDLYFFNQAGFTLEPCIPYACGIQGKHCAMEGAGINHCADCGLFARA